jgi:hypothetical protein
LKSGVLAWVLATASLASAANGIDTIYAYEGTWKCETEHFKTAYSEPKKESTTLRNDCWRSGGYFACDQFVDGKSVALIVFTYDAKEDVFHNYAVPVDGGEASSGKLLVKGNVWTFPWQATSKTNGQPIYFHVVNVFTTPDAIEYRQEFSSDQAHWTVMSKGVEKKQH